MSCVVCPKGEERQGYRANYLMNKVNMVISVELSGAIISPDLRLKY
jgi:hypothetical protein